MDILARKTQIPVPDCPTIGLDVRRVMFQTGDKEVSMVPSLLMRGVRHCAMVPRTAPVPLAPTRVTGFRTRGIAANAGVSFHLHYTLPPPTHKALRSGDSSSIPVSLTHATASIRPGTLVMILSSYSAQFWTLLNTPFGE